MQNVCIITCLINPKRVQQVIICYNSRPSRYRRSGDWQNRDYGIFKNRQKRESHVTSRAYLFGTLAAGGGGE